jgi:RNA recognition motif-containing protein
MSSSDTKVVQKEIISNIDPQFRKIFVGGLPHNLQDEEFKDFFIKFGDIEDCAILRDKRTGKPRGFGFVTYRDIETLEHVMEIKDSHTIQGKWVDCKRAVPAG